MADATPTGTEDSASRHAPKCPFELAALQHTDPFPEFEAARAKGSVVWDDSMGVWLVLDYAICVHIETNEERFSNLYANASPTLVQIKGGRGNITLSQGEEHERLRRFHLQLLSPKAVRGFRDSVVKPIIDRLIDAFVGNGKAELVSDFADQLPPRVIASLFGMPWQDDALIDQIYRWHQDIIDWIGRNLPEGEQKQKAISASDQLNTLLLPYIRKGRDEISESFTSRVWREAPDFFGAMTEEIALGICRELFLGGSDTTVHGISNALHLILTNNDMRAALTSANADGRPAALAGVVEESMRLFGSAQYRLRVAQQNCTLGGANISAGETLILMHAAANRDPSHYACPAMPDLNRRPIYDHLAFNRGPRACLGAGLARAEMQESIEAVLARLPNVRLDPATLSPRFEGLFMRSFKPLNVLFDIAEGSDLADMLKVKRMS